MTYSNMEPEFIFKITVTSPFSSLDSRLNLISDKYNNPQGHSFVYLTADQFGLNVENIFELDDYTLIILASHRTIQHLLLIFTSADITMECQIFEDEFYKNFDLNKIEPQILKDKMIRHMANKLNYNSTLAKIISRRKLNQIDYMIMQNKLIS